MVFYVFPSIGVDSDEALSGDGVERLARPRLFLFLKRTKMRNKMTAVKFWNILWGEEAYPLSTWDGVDLAITPSRFREALDRINEFLEENFEAEKPLPINEGLNGRMPTYF
jgi:hypothetical protein